MQMQKHADSGYKGSKNPIDPVLTERQNRGPSPGFCGTRWKVRQYR
jgi:hypothetical protein